MHCYSACCHHAQQHSVSGGHATMHGVLHGHSLNAISRLAAYACLPGRHTSVFVPPNIRCSSASKCLPVALDALLQLSSGFNTILNEWQDLAVLLVAEHIAQVALGIARQGSPCGLG